MTLGECLASWLGPRLSGGLTVIDLETGRLTELSAPTAMAPVFSPDGRCLAFRAWETKDGKEICRVK